MISYNLWQAIDLALTAGRRPHWRRWSGHRITMRIMVMLFCAYLDGMI
jgi:hypothetical protein